MLEKKKKVAQKVWKGKEEGESNEEDKGRKKVKKSKGER